MGEEQKEVFSMRPSSYTNQSKHVALNRAAPICSIPLHGPNSSVSLGKISMIEAPGLSHCLAVNSISGCHGRCTGLQTTRQPSSTRPMSLQYWSKTKVLKLVHAINLIDLCYHTLWHQTTAMLVWFHDTLNLERISRDCSPYSAAGAGAGWCDGRASKAHMQQHVTSLFLASGDPKTCTIRQQRP